MRFGMLKAVVGDPENVNLFQSSYTVIYHVGDWETCSVQYRTDETQAVLTLYRSNDTKTEGVLEVGETLGPADDMTDTIDCSGFLYLHVKVTTLAGSAASGKLVAIGKSS